MPCVASLKIVTQAHNTFAFTSPAETACHTTSTLANPDTSRAIPKLCIALTAATTDNITQQCRPAPVIHGG